MKTLVTFIFSLITIIFFVAIVPCEAGGGRRNHGGHHGGGHHYRWFGVIPRPQWAPYSGYYAVPEYTVPQYTVPPYYRTPPPNEVIGAPRIIGVPDPVESEVILVPQERQSFEDYQKPIHIPIPQESVAETEPLPSQPAGPRTPIPRRANSSKANTIEKYVTGEASCPVDLPKGGIVRVCNARSGKYKISQEGDEKYFHQQQCWFCENILGGNYVRWQEQKK